MGILIDADDWSEMYNVSFCVLFLVSRTCTLMLTRMASIKLLETIRGFRRGWAPRWFPRQTCRPGARSADFNQAVFIQNASFPIHLRNLSNRIQPNMSHSAACDSSIDRAPIPWTHCPLPRHAWASFAHSQNWPPKSTISSRPSAMLAMTWTPCCANCPPYPSACKRCKATARVDGWLSSEAQAKPDWHARELWWCDLRNA